MEDIKKIVIFGTGAVAAEITSYAATKINKNEPVSLEVLMRICQVFHCDIGDICEVILDE
jgi:putative transcriptional regulator